MSRNNSIFWSRLATSALALVAFASCQEVITEPEEAPVALQRCKLVISSSQEGSYPDYETRTELVNGSKVYWLPADEISVFSAGEMARFTSKNSDRVAKATFAGTISVPSGVAVGNDAYVWALYPYDADATYDNGLITSSLPSLQFGAKDSFADDLFPMMGRSLNPFVDDGNSVDFGVSAGGQGTSFYDLDDPDDPDNPDNPGSQDPSSTQKLRMTFMNIASAFRFTVDRSDIVSITMSATGGEALTGTYTAEFDGDGVPSITSVSEPASFVTITASDGEAFEPGVSYYMVCFPVQVSHGVTFTFVTEDGMTGTRTISSSFSFKRSKFSYKDHLDKNVIFTPDPSADRAGEFVYDSHTVVFDKELRGVWVATVKNIGFPLTSGAASQKQEMVELFADMKRLGFNAIFFQVCPMADAFWQSDLLPWSVYLTGTQGQDPGYDPLQLAVDTAHSLGMELHAWFNPYRIGLATDVRVEDHPMFLHEDWYETYKPKPTEKEPNPVPSYYWNPGVPELREFIASVMAEVVTNYDVDGTIIDDYFYPSGLQNYNSTWEDSDEYDQYGDGKSLYNWRVENVDKTVALYQEVTHEAKSNVVFGAAPGGTESYANSLYCYPPHWLKAGTVDYISPQIYWDHKRTDSANFDTVLNMWLGYDRKSDCPLVPSLAPYMVYDAGSSYYFKGHPDEMLYQVEDLRQKGLPGSIWYREKYCQKPLLTDYIPQEVFTSEVLTPQITLNPDSLPAPVVGITGTKMSWGVVQGAGDYVVLELTRESSSSTEWDASIVYSGPERSFTGQQGHYYIVLARSGSVRSTYSSVIYLG